MKLGKFEGTPDELKNVVENHGFNPELFIDIKTYKIKLWILWAIIAVFVILSCFLYKLPTNSTLYLLFFIINLVVLATIITMVHLKYRLWLITSFIFFIGGVIIGLSVGVLTPKEAANDIRKYNLINSGSKDTIKANSAKKDNSPKKNNSDRKKR